MIHADNYRKIKQEIGDAVTLVAVSKTKTVDQVQQLYDLGHRDFGENYVQELTQKAEALPKDIRWHYIGHLQSNKVKYIAPFVHLIHAVDSFKLMKEINKQAAKNNRVMDVLLQVHITKETTKFGLNEQELEEIFSQFSKEPLPHVCICGLMGMASFTEDMQRVKKEFKYLHSLFDKYSKLTTENCRLTILSMGMSNDYRIAVEEGSTMVRIGSLIFGERN